MIITQQDIDEFASEWQELQRGYGAPAEEFLAWLANNPQVVVAAGYQEFVGAHTCPLYQELNAWGVMDSLELSNLPLFRQFEGQWVIITEIGEAQTAEWLGLSLDAIRIGVDKAYEEERFHDRGRAYSDFEILDWGAQADIKESAVLDLPTFEEIVDRASKFVDNPLTDPTLFTSPKLWTPFEQARQKDLLAESSVELIRALQCEERELEDISWKQFEEIVAEVLRAQGMEIHLVDENPQGGRDILARCELVPGREVLTIAVEVKHRPVIDRPTVQMSLQQNRHFPALMFVTSGRFTSGVLKEAAAYDNRMRLYLKDGVAFRDMIRAYNGKLTP